MNDKNLTQKGATKTGGRPKGAKNKATVLFEGLLLGKREALINKAIKMAEEGNERILCTLLNKILPDLTKNHNINETYEDALKRARKELRGLGEARKEYGNLEDEE